MGRPRLKCIECGIKTNLIKGKCKPCYGRAYMRARRRELAESEAKPKPASTPKPADRKVNAKVRFVVYEILD